MPEPELWERERERFSQFSQFCNPPPLISLPLFQLDELFLRPNKKILRCSKDLKGGGNVSSEPDEAFAFDRTISRLKEMGGSAYLMKYEQQQ